MKQDRVSRALEKPLGSITQFGAIRIGRAICGELHEAERREWWITNGRGGYAAGTVAGTLTRGYHGLLVAPVDPPLGRRLLVVKMDATLIDGERHWPLFSNRWADGRIDPAGHVLIESFRLEGRMPVWRWACADLLIEQRIWMPPEENRVWLAYRLLRGRSGAEPRLRSRTAARRPGPS
jgi:predicted glycogen debranching enzyme